MGCSCDFENNKFDMARNIHEESIFLCGICLEPLIKASVALALNCLHTFCGPCLKKLQEQSEDRRKLKCPSCRQITDIKSGYLSDLPRNFYLNSTDIPPCFNCKNPATGWCLNCVKYICSSCKIDHLQNEVFEAHLVSPFLTSTTEVCYPHRSRIKFVCKVCKEDMCEMCAAEKKHKDHRRAIVCIQNAFQALSYELLVRKEKSMEQLKCQKNYGEQAVEEFKEKINEVKRLRMKITNLIEEEEKNITERMETEASKIEQTVKNINSWISNMENASKEIETIVHSGNWSIDAFSRQKAEIMHLVQQGTKLSQEPIAFPHLIYSWSQRSIALKMEQVNPIVSQ